MDRAGLTTASQTPKETSFHAFSDPKTNDRPFLIFKNKSKNINNHTRHNSPDIAIARREIQSPRHRQQQSPSSATTRKPSLHILPPRAFARSAASDTASPSPSPSPSSSHSHSPCHRAELSISRLQHARQLSLQQSLEKPLPHTPAPPPLSKFRALATKPGDLSSSPLSRLRNTHDPDPDPDPDRILIPDAATSASASAMDSVDSAPPTIQAFVGGQDHYAHHDATNSNSNSNSTQYDAAEDHGVSAPHRSNGSTPAISPAMPQGRSQSTSGPTIGGGGGGGGGGSSQQPSSAHLSGLMCNVHRTTGSEPPPLVGATTTILGDKLYVFGGRNLSRNRAAPLTSDLFELDLIRRHWTRVEAAGDIPPPRYFHSMCPLGDTKMVCYGGMSPAPNQPVPAGAGAGAGAEQQQPGVTVMSDIYIFDVLTRSWTHVQAYDSPQGRYAHCACILPSCATFSTKAGPLSALQHNQSGAKPNEGQIGIHIDGTGGAQMVIVGGQDGANHYIEQISVFNLRSLRWISTQSLGKSCGAYRSVATPLPPSISYRVGGTAKDQQSGQAAADHEAAGQIEREAGSAMLIYSNYNFLDVKLELQIRAPDGTLTERPMSGTYSPPGLRFPNGGIIDTHFVVSGTYLTSSKQEYALWALDLRTFTWSRIDAGGSVFSQGSWNRGVLWNRRNTFVILGNRRRSLVDDYNHRRINFSNVCMVELEAFGFYDNPRKTNPMSGFISASSPYSGPGLKLARKAGYTAGGRFHSRASEELGAMALSLRELADMDILCLNGERIPVNSRVVARRWGPYFVQLLREGTATQDGSDSATLRSGMSSSNNPARASILTVTPSRRSPRNSISSTTSTILSSATTLVVPGTPTAAGPTSSSSASAGSSAAAGPAVNSNSNSNSNATTSTSTSTSTQQGGEEAEINPATINSAPTPRSLAPGSRPRVLYLPHTYLTVQALLHFLYASALPGPSSPLCTPQILCSLLQIARPYRIDGLLEAVVERLHALLDNRNAAAVFNATAMAAGGGRGIDGSLNPNFFVGSLDPVGSPVSTSDFSLSLNEAGTAEHHAFSPEISARMADLGLGLGVGGGVGSMTHTHTHSRPPSRDVSRTPSVSGSDWGSEMEGSDGDGLLIWNGELSSVIGLQKRGLRGLMEGRRMRERTGTGPGPGSAGGSTTSSTQQSSGQRVGLGLGISGP